MTARVLKQLLVVMILFSALLVSAAKSSDNSWAFDCTAKVLSVLLLNSYVLEAADLIFQVAEPLLVFELLIFDLLEFLL